MISPGNGVTGAAERWSSRKFVGTNLALGHDLAIISGKARTSALVAEVSCSVSINMRRPLRLRMLTVNY